MIDVYRTASSSSETPKTKFKVGDRVRVYTKRVDQDFGRVEWGECVKVVMICPCFDNLLWVRPITLRRCWSCASINWKACKYCALLVYTNELEH